MNESQMRSLVENYYTNLTLLTEKQNQLDYDIKVTATYGLNAGGGGGFSNSKVENTAIKHASNRNSIEELEYKIRIVDESMKILNNKEREVITKIKVFRNKLSKIAKELNQKTKYVYDTRKRAIKKMCEYVKRCKYEL